jgi:hypothetical protein
MPPNKTSMGISNESFVRPLGCMRQQSNTPHARAWLVRGLDCESVVWTGELKQKTPTHNQQLWKDNACADARCSRRAAYAHSLRKEIRLVVAGHPREPVIVFAAECGQVSAWARALAQISLAFMQTHWQGQKMLQMATQRDSAKTRSKDTTNI